MPNTLSPEGIVAQQRALFERAWNTLIPPCAARTVILRNKGVAYLHPTKGWRIVGKKRWAIRGVL